MTPRHLMDEFTIKQAERDKRRMDMEDEIFWEGMRSSHRSFKTYEKSKPKGFKKRRKPYR